MKRGFIICLLVFGLTYALEDNVGSETKESSQTTGGSINFRFFDKNKRGATKITNTDSPSFNHLSSSNTITNTASSSSGFKPSTATSNPPPFRYLYNQQYYQPNPYLTYVQLPQAAQIAAQYSFQASPVAHFLQTPTQIQYVAAPTIAQAPQIKYQGFTNEYSTANSAASDSSSSSTTSAQYVPQPQQAAAATPSQSYVTSASSSGSSASSTASQAKQVQVPLFSSYQTAQPVYYTQQPFITYFQQPQAANFIYQQPNANYLLKQQQQIANIYGANRFGFYTPTQNTQLTYLVPMVVTQPEQDSTSTTSSLKSSDKTVSHTQQPASSNSFTFGTKA